MERSDYCYGILFVVFTLIFEVINFVTLGIGVLPSKFGLELSIILIIAGLIYILPTEWLKIAVSSLFLGLQGVLNIINACIYKNLFNFSTIDMLFARGGETGAVFELDFLNWGCLVSTLVAFGVYIALVVILPRRLPRLKTNHRISSIGCMILIAVVLESTGLLTYGILDKKYSSEDTSAYAFENGSYLYGSTDLKFANMKNYGFYAYYLKSIAQYVDYETELSESEEKELRQFVNEGEGFSYTDSTYGEQSVSGLLSGDNLIMIMMESMEWFAIDPYNTPHLYSLIYEDSTYFSNYYSRNATNFSEDISINGNCANEYAYSRILKEVGVSTPESLPNLFKDAGYENVNFFHDYLGEFYDRDTLNVAFGFDNVYALEQTNLDDKSEKFGDFVDDGDFVEYWKETFMPSDKSFFSFFTTVSTHGPYTSENYRFEDYRTIFDENYTAFAQLNEGESLGYTLPKVGTRDYEILREYKAKAMALDNAIGVILDYLSATTNSNGQLLSDCTTIVVFADHNAYYQNLSYKIKGVGKYDNNSTAYRVPLAISSSKLQKGEVDTFCNTYDLFPTLCDLYGFSFNSNLTQGYSIFSSDISKSMFLSSLSVIFDENVYSLDMESFYIDSKEVTQDNALVTEFKDKVNTYVEKQTMIEKYYRVNYAKNYA